MFQSWSRQGDERKSKKKQRSEKKTTPKEEGKEAKRRETRRREKRRGVPQGVRRYISSPLSSAGQKGCGAGEERMEQGERRDKRRREEI